MDEDELEFDPDYHEREEFEVAMMGLSQFIIQWNWAEHSFNVLLWALSGDFFTGAQYTTGLGNHSRSDLMLVMARRKEKDAEIFDLIEFCVQAFRRLKDNRNSLAHAHSIAKHGDEEKPRWLRASKNPKSLHIFVYADELDVIKNFGAACLLGTLLGELTAFYISRFEKKPRPVSKKFDLPPLLQSFPVPIETGDDNTDEPSS